MPGYHAPEDTIEARSRDVIVMGRIVSDAWRAGAVIARDADLPPELESKAANLSALMPEVPEAIVWRALSAWTALYGWVSFEVFGQFNNVFEDRRPAYEHAMRLMADTMGLAQ
ncbi:TetR-like C-terminal domain-containing protein [Nonomuraea antimicrobica]